MPGTVVLPFDTGAYSSPNRCILADITSSTPSNSFALTAGDQVNLVLYPRTLSPTSGAASTTARIPQGTTITVAAKPTTSLDANSVLFVASDFSESNDGSGNSGNWLYTGLVNLNTTELAAAIPTGSQSIPVMLVIELTDPQGNTQRFLATILVYNETFSGNEGSTTSATQSYFTAAQTSEMFAQLAPAQGSYRMKTESDGTINLQFYNATTGLFHTLFPSGPAGAIQTVWGIGES